MKNLILIIIVFTTLSTSGLYAQQENNQTITVKGSHSEVLEPTGIVLSLDLKQIYETCDGQFKVTKSYEDILEKVKEVMKEMGFEDIDIVLNKYKGYKSYGRSSSYLKAPGNSREYAIQLPLLDDPDQLIAKLNFSGIKSKNVSFYYVPVSREFENAMYTKAIEDAKLKANHLAKTLNKKIGQVVVIDENGNNKHWINSDHRNKMQQPTEKSTKALYVHVSITYTLVN